MLTVSAKPPKAGSQSRCLTAHCAHFSPFAYAFAKGEVRSAVARIVGPSWPERLEKAKQMQTTQRKKRSSGMQYRVASSLAIPGDPRAVLNCPANNPQGSARGVTCNHTAPHRHRLTRARLPLNGRRTGKSTPYRTTVISAMLG